MCKRSDNDPLVRVLTDRYRLNILRIPRQGVGVGELLVKEGKDLKIVGNVRHFFDPELEFQEAQPAQLPDIDGLTSSPFSAKVAASPLSGLLAALGIIGVSSIGALLKRTREVSVAFSLTGMRYRTTDLVVLGNELTSRVLRRDNALYAPRRDFFVAYAAAEATGIRVRFGGATEEAAKVALDVEQLLKTETSIAVAKAEECQLVFSGPVPVTLALL